ncbi:type II toxin-antitoxin system HicA family toxin [Calditerricola satsumensis]|nr:type II toxin-antitoxin system HicA family toxin [Calditerricola satsumensis]
MKDRPNSIRFDEVVKVLRAFGYEVVRIRGSHHQFRNAAGNTFTSPKRNPV